MNISFIIPFYDGNKYIGNAIKSIVEAYSKVENTRIEIIIVNDSPQIQVCVPEEYNKYDIKIINKERNEGIHKSRVLGLKSAIGDWIVFLDQDDCIFPNFIASNLKYLKQDNSDVIVGNGYREFKDKTELIYHNISIMKYKIREYFMLHNMNGIISPGMCLIRKKSISNSWLDNTLQNNGIDDWFLWLLLFNDKAKFVCNNDVVYVHKFVDGGNYSSNRRRMYASCCETYDNLIKIPEYPNNKAQIFYSTIKYKNEWWFGNKIKAVLYYFWRFIDNLKYLFFLKFVERGRN